MCWKKWVINLFTALVLLFALATNVNAHNLSTQVLDGHGGDFTLQSSDGPISLQQFRGKLVLLFFGYTSCSDICPTTLAILSNAFAKLEARELNNITTLFVSLDPDRDTPELLQEYTSYFHPNIIGVTDRVEVLKQVAADYGVTFERKESAGSALDYVINHPFDVLVVNQEGQLLDGRILPATSSDDISAYLKDLLGRSS